MSVVVSPELLALYAKCPNKVKYLKQKIRGKGLSIHGKIVKIIIQKYHQSLAQSGYEPTQRQIIGWIESECRRLLRSSDPQEVYLQSKDVLVCIERWQKNVFQKYPLSGLINIPVDLTLDYDVFFQDTLELVLLSPEMTLLIAFSEDEITSEGLYSSLQVQSKIWGFYRATEHKPTMYINLLISPKKVVDIPIQILPTTLGKSESNMKHIMRGLREKVYYPVRSGQCKSCPYRDRCSY